MTEEQKAAIERAAESLYPAGEYGCRSKREGYTDAATEYAAEIETLKATMYTEEEISKALRPGKMDLYQEMNDFIEEDGLHIPDLLKNWIVGFMQWRAIKTLSRLKK